MPARPSNRWRVRPATGVRLADVDPGSTAGAPGEKEATNAAAAEGGERLFGWQERLYAEKKQSLLVVLQAMDTGGKDGTIKHVIGRLNPVGVRVESFKQPTEDELAHDFLWRVHQRTPAQGQVAAFNRSHYEDVVIVRVHELVPEAVWRARYDHINAFEAMLTERGTRVVKVFLHISKEEQAKRLQARREDPTKQWKFRRGDLEERAYWDDYMEAYEDAISATSTAAAPWFVVPADHKWYRDWAVTQILLDAFEEMDPQYPRPEDAL